LKKSATEFNEQEVLDILGFEKLNRLKRAVRKAAEWLRSRRAHVQSGSKSASGQPMHQTKTQIKVGARLIDLQGAFAHAYETWQQAFMDQTVHGLKPSNRGRKHDIYSADSPPDFFYKRISVTVLPLVDEANQRTSKVTNPRTGKEEERISYVELNPFSVVAQQFRSIGRAVQPMFLLDDIGSKRAGVVVPGLITETLRAHIRADAAKKKRASMKRKALAEVAGKPKKARVSLGFSHKRMHKYSMKELGKLLQHEAAITRPELLHAAPLHSFAARVFGWTAELASKDVTSTTNFCFGRRVAALATMMKSGSGLLNTVRNIRRLFHNRWADDAQVDAWCTTLFKFDEKKKRITGASPSETVTTAKDEIKSMVRELLTTGDFRGLKLLPDAAGVCTYSDRKSRDGSPYTRPSTTSKTDAFGRFVKASPSCSPMPANLGQRKSAGDEHRIAYQRGARDARVGLARNHRASVSPSGRFIRMPLDGSSPTRYPRAVPVSALPRTLASPFSPYSRWKASTTPRSPPSPAGTTRVGGGRRLTSPYMRFMRDGRL
jgi:hypothetical protein